MRFSCNKHAILLFAVWLSLGFVLVGYSHDRNGHAKDIGVVFGLFSPENDKIPKKSHGHGKDLRKDVGEIIANLIDVGARDFHRTVNKELGDICCESKYSSLYIKGYNQKISDLKESFKEIPDRLKLLEDSDRRNEVIKDLRSISEEMQDDFFFNQDCSAMAFNVELTLNEFEKHLEYNHDVSSDKVRSAFQDLKDALDRVPEMSQHSQDEVQKKIRDLAANERLFKWGEYGHRLYFHWGMDVDIHDFGQLKTCIDRACEDLKKAFFPRSGARRRGNASLRTAEDDAKFQELQERLRKKIYTLIEDEWEQRKQKALKELERCLRKYNNDKYELSDDQREMLLKLAYYVHILGDHTTSNTSALIEEKDINEALLNKVFEYNNWGHKKDNEILTKIRNELPSKNTAKDMMDFLKVNTPILIEGSPKIKNVLQ